MNSYTMLQRNIAKLAIITLIIFISPISAVNAATGNISVVTEVSTPTNDVTPDYTFNSDSTGSIAYTGPCSSVLTTLVSTGNMTITLNSLPEGIYSTCTIQVDNGEGPSNLLTLATFIVDVTAPVVTLSGSTPMTIFSGSTYNEPGADWVDPMYGTGDTFSGIYGNTGSFQSSGSVNTNQTGSYTVEYLKVDAAGNAGTATRTVNVIMPDTVPPVVTLSGAAMLTIAHGSVYTDSGADWTDNVDGSGNILFGVYADTGSFQSSGSVNTGALGVYTIEYLKVDTSGNTGSTTRTITVTDQTAPVVTLSGSTPMTIFSGSTYTDLGADWTDTVDGSGNTLVGIYGNTGSFQSTGSVNTNQTGSYTITYLKVDAAGNTGSVTRTVNVVDSIPPDTTPPTLTGTVITTVFSGSTYIDSGISWTDNIDGSGNTLIGIYGNTGSFQSTGSVNTNQTGSYTLIYLKVDASGNTGSLTRTVNVVDQINFVFNKSNTGIINVIPGTNNFKLFDGTLESIIPITIWKINIASINNGTGITAFVNDLLSVKLNGSEIGTISALYSTGIEIPVSFLVNSSNPAVLTVEGSTKNNNNIIPSSNQFTVTITEIHDSLYNSRTNLGTGSSLTDDQIIIVSNIPDTTAPTVTINTKLGQLDPTTTSPVIYTTVFSEPIDVSTFTKGTLSTSGSTASGIVINSITEVAPYNGTTFEILVSASGTGKVVLSIPQGTGAVSSIFGTTGLSPYNSIIDGTGNLYVTNWSNNNITKITPSGVSTVFGTTGTGPSGIIMDGSGNIYTANSVSKNVSKITPSGISTILGITGNWPSGIIMDGSGNIYTANSNSGTVTKITPSGVSTTFGTTGASPTAITIDMSGNIYTANRNSHTVTKITQSGVSTVFGTTEYNPWSIIMDGSGNIYTANNGSNNVTKITPSGVSTTFGTTGANPTGITIDALGNIYTSNYVNNNPSNSGTNTVTKITPSGVSTTFGTIGFYPNGINLDVLGNIYVVNSNSGTISKVIPPGITDLAGNYNIASTATDNEVTIRTPDTTRPIVTLIGSGTQTVYSGSTYTDLGASWTDNIDGTGNTLSGIYGNAGSFQSTGTVNTNQTGSYTLTYLKVDAAGNTGSVTRTVTVIGTFTLSGSVSGTGSAVVSTGTVQPGTLVITNGNTINTTGSSGSSLSIPGSVNFLLSGSVWDGILYAPVLSTVSVLSIGDAGVVSNLPQDTPTTDYSYTVLPTLMAGGTGGTSVIASGGVFTLSMQVNSPSVSSGTSLPIFRSNDSVTWEVNTPQSSCVLNAALMCTFTTDHLSYFGFVRVTSTPITVTTTTSSTGPGGGSYSYSYIPNPTTTNGVVVDTITNNTVVTTTTPVRTTQRNNPRATTSDSFLDDLFGDTTDNSNTDNSSTSTDNNNNNNNNSSSNSNYTPAVIGTAYVSVKNSLRVRAGTSFNTAVVAYIYRNQEIEVIDNDTPNWSHIQFRTAKGTLREGYILSYYVREMTNIDKIRGGIISFAEATMNMPELTGYINVAHSLNLRSGPSVYTRVKAILKPNTQVIILDTIGKWREIMTEKYHGYVLSKYIK